MAGVCILLFVITIVFGGVHFGARNWINVFGMSLQPSELAKLCFIFAGAATLDRLFVKRNVLGFMLLSGFCLAALAITGDFGTASIFFVVFLVIAYMRSGDYTTLLMICGAAKNMIPACRTSDTTIASNIRSTLSELRFIAIRPSFSLRIAPANPIRSPACLEPWAWAASS